MKKILTCVLLALTIIPLAMNGQTYDNLWGQAQKAENEDLPQTQRKVLGQIIKKAEQEANYGQLPKALLTDAQVAYFISPDSLAPTIEQLRKREQEATSRPLQAVYDAVLAQIYQHNEELDDQASDLAEAYSSKAMEKPEELAKVKATDYEPFVIKGADSRFFDDDLLSVIGMETNRYDLLHQYYLTTSNRKAQLLTALEIYNEREQLDSLISLYGDLEECGEAAIRRYHCMEAEERTTVEEKMTFIDEALKRWGSWKRMDKLRNERNSLTSLVFNAYLPHKVWTPNRSQTMEVRSLRGINELTVRLYRVKANGDIQLNPDYEEGYQKLKSLLTPLEQLTQTRRYEGKLEYETFSDSLELPGLSPGVYMIEMESKPKTQVSRKLYFVSDVRVLSQSLPDNQIRYVAVHATTGQPLPGAQLRLIFRHYYDPKDLSKDVICNEQGEYLYSDGNTHPMSVFATTKDDRFCPIIVGAREFYSPNTDPYTVRGEVFTDRAIYRPGQTVHACAIIYRVRNGFEHSVSADVKVKAVLRDANYKVVEEHTMQTDAFGTAACDFTLPQKGLTGNYSIEMNGYRQYFRVEEYKRPTFQVDIPKPAQDYKAGDTLVVKGSAKSFAGVPVQGARVSYTVSRRQAWWWLSYMRYWNMAYMGTAADEEEIFEGETITNADGSFEVKMPMVLPEGLHGTMFYNFVVTADVTDTAGETRHGELSLPLGNRKTALSVDLPNTVQKEKLPSVTFHLRNAAGTDLSGEVSYRIDQGKWQEAQTNTPIASMLTTLKSGRHQLEAICKEDTVKQEFIVFSIDDKRPAADTDDWFWVSDKQFPNDGKPVTVQVGSSAKDMHIVYSIVAGKKIIESGAVEKSEELINRKLTYQEEYGNGLVLSFAWYKNGIAHQHTVSIQRPLPDKQLRLKWETFRDRLTPGQQEEWTLKIEAPAAHSSSSADVHSPIEAQLLATLYDKSLDEIDEHNWKFVPFTRLPLPSLQWVYSGWGSIWLNGAWEKSRRYIKELMFSMFDHNCMPTTRSLHRYTRTMLMKSAGYVEERLTANEAMPATVDREIAVASQKAIGAFDVAGQETADEDDGVSEEEAKEKGSTSEVQMRENLQETAFFYPQLLADSTGIVALKFTLPESLTTWRFMGIAHTKDLMYGMIEGEAVAQKDVMIQPNMPRFLRTGDKATLSARIFNTTDKAISCKAQLILSDPESQQVVYQEQTTCLLEANGTSSVSFHTNDETLTNRSLLVCKMIVAGEGFSDGEQHYLPILPNRERVTVTVPFTQTEPGTKTIDLAALVPTDATQGKLTFEYTNNPAWLMIQALPSVGHPHDDCAICQAVAYYANSIGQHILKQNPQAKHVFEMWKQEDSSLFTLHSSLQKNEELKDLLLSETPWVMDADREAEQKQRLSDFFDTNLLQNRLNTSVEQLKKLQNADGSWSWWPGMDGSFYMTVEISEMLVRLNQMTKTQQSSKDMLKKSFKFMDKEILELVEEMKKEERKGYNQTFPSFKALQYLYLSTLDGRPLSAKVSDAQAYLKKLLKKDVKNQTLYEKALSAIILHAPLYIKSLKEYTVYKEDMGRYYDSPRASYSWRDYRIPTQVAAIEAIQRLTPQDTVTIDEMRRWLLQEKRTQAWDTPINSAEAIYAFLNNNQQALLPQAKTVLKVDGNPLETSEATAGIGYVKTSAPTQGQKTFTAEKSSTGTSWGAVYAQFMQTTKDIADQSSEISVKREVFMSDGTSLASLSSLKVGQHIKVRLTINTQRDLDFVEVIDRRAACMEPLNQLSGYHNGAYTAPRDNATHYFYNWLPKGKHRIETEYYIDRTGIYETGTCTVQCAYAPEYRGTTHSLTLEVKADSSY